MVFRPSLLNNANVWIQGFLPLPMLNKTLLWKWLCMLNRLIHFWCSWICVCKCIQHFSHLSRRNCSFSVFPFELMQFRLIPRAGGGFPVDALHLKSLQGQEALAGGVITQGRAFSIRAWTAVNWSGRGPLPLVYTWTLSSCWQHDIEPGPGDLFMYRKHVFNLEVDLRDNTRWCSSLL